MWQRLKSAISSDKASPTVPDGRRVYAIGDIHGRVDLLNELLARIEQDAAAYPDHDKVLISLGDMVDRGPASQEVIDCLATLTLPGFDIVCLRGNHEEMMMAFLDNPERGELWLFNGGDATLASYGLRLVDESQSPADLGAQFANLLPATHLSFLQSLGHKHIEGDYAFVHAGIRPGIRLENQQAEDLMWIREPFLNSRRDHGKVVVHGHSVRYQPEFFPEEERPRRIGIDTGAFQTGVLTCLALEGTSKSLIQTGSRT